MVENGSGCCRVFDKEESKKKILMLILDEQPRLIERKQFWCYRFHRRLSELHRASACLSSAVALWSLKKAIPGFAALHQGHFVFSSLWTLSRTRKAKLSSKTLNLFENSDRKYMRTHRMRYIGAACVLVWVALMDSLLSFLFLFDFPQG